MGIYRFVLACLVVLAHTEVVWGTVYNPGMIAVISFFILSGFSMEKMYDSYKTSAIFFYMERWLRIAPQYLFWTTVTLFMINLGYVYSNNWYLRDMTFSNIFLNVLILPVGYFMYNGLDNFRLIPQAWTLGTEFTFYLILPLLYTKRKLINYCMIGSVIIYTLACFGILESNVWGYRLLPGVLFLFLLGILISRGGRNWKKVLVIWFYCVMLFVLSHIKCVEDIMVVRSSIVGILLGIPIIYLLKSFPRNFIDRVLGRMSYGIYLNHFLLIWIWKKPETNNERIALLIISAIISIITYIIIEKPCDILRNKIRERK